MDEIEIFDTPVANAGDMGALLLRFLFNSVFIWIIIQKLYYPKSQRRDYYFTFALISVSIFFLIYLLGSVKIKVGFALGLFAIFGIIRYRTESMSVREMTYLFVIIAVSVINALAVTLSYGELLLTNVIFIICIRLCENIPYLKSRSEKLVVYDRIDLIKPDCRDELLKDLKDRLGLDIIDVEVGAVDFLRDTAMLKVYYGDRKGSINTVDNMLKIPKDK
ncbi:MAG: DUF4956 domain-containing protein [Muribaculaceae bacterium]|jgi:hypothetical protein|nr:DUF4956 domain-containing protein [Muribaculaceae bacterium]HUN20712.1 DUF4956 domain-containing protein [Muribaculaceae bacterium]